MSYMSEYEKRFDFWKYEKKVLNKLSKLSALIADNTHLGLPVSDYMKQLTEVGGKNRKSQVELLDRRIDKIHREIKRLKQEA
jgi:cytochrome c oxidase assembly protein Cox11